MSTRNKIAKVFAKKKADEDPDCEDVDSVASSSPSLSPQKDPKESKRAGIRDKDGPFHLLLGLSKDRDKEKDKDKEGLPLSISTDTTSSSQASSTAGALPGSPSVSKGGFHSKVNSFRNALHIPGTGSGSRPGSLKSENENVLSQMATPSGMPFKKGSTVPKASEVFPKAAFDNSLPDRHKHDAANPGQLESEYHEYQKAVGILFQRLEHIKEKSNEEFLEMKQYLDSEWERQPLSAEAKKDLAACISKFDFNVKKWLMLPTSDFEANIVKEVVYEVQKIQELWKGTWRPQNFTHRMVLLIGQTTPIIENLKLDPKELKAVFDKAKKPKEDPSVEIDRDIYSVYWSGSYKEIERNAADQSADEIHGLVRCRICDDLLPSTLLESHSKICVQISKWEMELSQYDETLANFRTRVTSVSLELLRLDNPTEQDRKDIKLLQEIDEIINLGLDYLTSDTIFEARKLTSFSLKYLPLDQREATTTFYGFAKSALETVQKKIETAQKGLKATQDIVKVKKIRPKEALESLLPKPAEARGDLKRTRSIASAYNRKTRVENLNEKLSHRPSKENMKVRKALNAGILEEEEEPPQPTSSAPTTGLPSPPTARKPLGSESPAWGIRNKKSSIQDFRIVKIISRGAFGRVFLAQKKSTGDYYAIKVLRKKEMLNRSQLDHVKAEQTILTLLNHSFVVKLYYSFESEENLYLVMEYLSGGDLFSLLKNVGCLNEEWARMYIAELVHALDYLHSKDIVHRDLKPDNLLIGSDGHLKLTDFGLSKYGLMNKTNQWSTMSSVGLSEKAKRTSTALNLELLDLTEQNEITMALVSHVENVKISGTPDYLAPETIMGIGYGPAVDFWAVGAILYELIVGIPPFNAETPQEVFENILTRRLFWPDDISEPAQDLIDHLLTLDHTKRLGCAGADEVKSHPFFEGIDWNGLLSQEAISPKPSNTEDTAYFEMKSNHRTQSIIHIEDELSGRTPLSKTFQSDGVFGNFHFQNIEFLESANLDMIKRVNRTVRMSMKKQNRPRTHSSPNKIDGSVSSLKKVMYCLIASPNPVASRSIQNWLKKKGILSSIFTNGIDAAHFALEKKTYDVIFLDLSLPNLSGIEVAQLIRSEECANQHTRIILFTAIMDDADTFVADGLECYLQSSLMKTNIEDMLTTWSPAGFLQETQ